MCGIVGIIGKAEVAPLLVEGLRRPEYRGYDSAGMAPRGVPEISAHPHATKYAAVAPNGIVENFPEPSAEPTAAGGVCESETDTEAMQ